MVELATLGAYCDQFLECARFDDHCPNGLQVEAGSRTHLLVTGVTASQAVIDAAVALGADTLLVHHGFFWKGENPCLTGMKGHRIRALMRNGISLLAYHLPLDAHLELGNNRQLARVLGFQEAAPVDPRQGLLWVGCLPMPLSLEQLALQVDTALGRKPLAITGSGRPVKRVAWCTGAAQDLIEQAARVGADAFLSGEIAERTVHQARELSIHYLAAGHHATERHGVQALGEHLAARFNLRHSYLEVENPA